MRRGDGLREDPPAGMLYDLVINGVVNELRNVIWKIPDDFLQFSHYLRVVKDLEFTSSPGVPYLYTFPNIGTMFGYRDGTLDDDRLLSVWGLVKQRLIDRSCDPIRVFVKAEPHKVKKLENKAYRLIASVSVVDQIIDALLFNPLNDLVVENFIDSPIKVGWSPYKGGWKMMPLGGVVATDASSWDWTVKSWLLQMELDVRKQLCSNLTQEWEDLANWRYKCLFDSPVWQTSFGFQLRQRHPGVMKSGCVNTIVSNSIMQIILHHRVAMEVGQQAESMFCMGDDVLQTPQSDMKTYLQKKNEYCIIKSAAQVSEFAGHRFLRDSIEPLYLGKHAFQLLHANPKYVREMAISYALLYHRSDKRETLRRLLAEIGQELPSESLLDAIFDGE
uniref:RdRp catalytic domain-containing protein n=1 Tax=Riboviria sp. TaxID=2585031 RepID=A0A8K1U2L0_9VIRU|nr:MAG: hypothetical protein 2 [Riboviria sp.]